MEELLNTFGQTIKDARQAANLTQDALAEQAGITTRYIMAIENENKLPRVKVLYSGSIVKTKIRSGYNELEVSNDLVM